MAAQRAVPQPDEDRADEVRGALAGVVDPELDEAVTELGFVTALEVGEAGDVAIEFRLPTYWCAANFAFLMADDMRRAVQVLPWVREVRVRLREHMYEEQINVGVAEGAGFRKAFEGQASEELDGLRRTFLVKAFQRRQEALLQHLIDSGQPSAHWIGIDVARLARLPLDDVGKRLVERYLERRFVIGPPGDAARPAAQPAFVDTAGLPLTVDGLAEHMRVLRGVCVNAEFNGVLCRGLLAVRDNAAATQPIRFMPRRGEARS